MEKKEQELRALIQEWFEGDADNRFRDPDDITEEYADTFIASEGLENFGYTDADRDEIYTVVSEVVTECWDEAHDIYSIAEEWDGNGYNNYLEDYEWEEIFHNAPDVYVEALHRRESFVVNNFEWASIPDLVWGELEENVEEQLGFISYNPMAVIDNVIINGSYGDFDDFKEEEESDEEFISREEDSCYRIFPEERFIIYSL